MFSRLTASASLCALALVGVALPASATPSVTRANARVRLPTPSAQARRDGVQPGNAPMNWSRAGSGNSVASLGAPLGRMSARTASASSATLTAGIDVSGYTNKTASQTWGDFWTGYMNQGYQFAFLKATEGTYYSPSSSGAKFNNQWRGATTAGIIRGAYHFANPHDSGGRAQADFFIANGGGWTADGKTLPGVLDIEYNPYRASNGLDTCYGLSNAQMVTWVQAFVNEYYATEHVYPIIYSTVGWWKMCTGNSSAFSKTDAFWLADPNTGSSTSGPGSLTAGTGGWSFWQYGQQSSVDLNKFNGAYTDLQGFAADTFPVGPHMPAATASGLGAPIGPEIAVTTAGGTGYYQSYPNGMGLITAPNGTTYQESGATYTSWSPFTYGWPTSAMTAVNGLGGAGTVQTFSGIPVPLTVYETPTTGAAWLSGPVLTQYQNLGGPSWGWPTTSLQTQSTFGVLGSYIGVQGGRAIINSKYGMVTDDGSDGGAIFAAWSPAGWGWPTGPLTAISGAGLSGYQQTFSKGTTGAAQAFTTTSTGTAWVDGALLSAYQRLGGPRWGWPLSSVKKQSAYGVPGSSLSLQGGRSLINSKYGTFKSVGGDKGAIYASWSPARYGWPRSDVMRVNTRRGSGFQQRFIAGTTTTRAFRMRRSAVTIWMSGPILNRYDALGGTRKWGWPTSSMTTQNAFGVRGSIQKFPGGRALIASRYGVFASSRKILTSWRSAQRGWPTTDLKARVLRGQPGWIQTYRRGRKGIGYGFLVQRTRAMVWKNGKP